MSDSPWIQLRGLDAPPPLPVRLRAGRLEAELYGADLRYVRVESVEIVRRLQIIVRDHRWRTVAAQVTRVEARDSADRFEVSFDCAYRLNELVFEVRGTIAADARGHFTYRMQGRAITAFDYCRIGLVVLHPPSTHAGRPFRARGPGGEFAGTLPSLVGPMGSANGVSVPLFEPFDALEVALADGPLAYQFAGELFEIEDQRNWSDASFKTYSPPIASGFPRWLHAGARVEQSVEICGSAVVARAPRRMQRPPELEVGSALGLALAPIGLCLDSGAYDAAALRRVRGLGIAHLRAELRVGGRDAADRLRAAVAACKRSGTKLELALFAAATEREALDALAPALAGAQVARVLAYGAGARSGTPSETTPAALVALVRARLGPALEPGVPIGGGTARFLCEINRTRPDCEVMDVVAYSTDATFHEADDLSLFETLEAQGDGVRTARAFAGGAKVVVTPIRLVSAQNPRVLAASASGPPTVSIDRRQASVLLGPWTLGTVKYATEAGAAALTLYDVTGPGGVMADAHSGALGPPFPSAPWAPYPVQTVLTALSALRGAPLLRCASSAPLQVIGLATENPDGIRLLAANLTPRPLDAVVCALGARRPVALPPYGLAVERWP